MTGPNDPSITIRSFRPEDAQACATLYQEGLVGGRIAENDTGLDLDDIQNVYMNQPGNHLWVAVNREGEVVGMVAVQHHEEGEGEIRRLRVRNDHRRRGIGAALMETALRFCQERQYLKIRLDTFMEREPAIKLFEKFRFRHSFTRQVHGKDLMYFYLDLYSSDDRPPDKP